MKNENFWEIEMPQFPRLKSDTSSDVIIFGAGMAGLSLAYELSKNNLDVIVIDSNEIAHGESYHTSAHLTVSLDMPFHSLEKTHGLEVMKKVANSHTKAIDQIEAIVNAEKIDCDFQRCNAYIISKENDLKILAAEKDAMQKVGISARITTIQLKNEGVHTIELSQQAFFHPLKYLAGLANTLKERGIKIYTNTSVIEVDKNIVHTDTGHVISAKHIIVATNSPINIKYGIYLKQTAYRTYMIGSLIKKDEIKGMYSELSNQKSGSFKGYYYARVHPYDSKHDLLLCGGEDHPTGLTSNTDVQFNDPYRRLSEWSKKYFQVEKIKYKWSGQVMETMDGLAYIGKYKDYYIVTGDCGNGLTYSIIASRLISDLLNSKPNVLQEIFDPERFKLFKSGSWIKSTIAGFATYIHEKEILKKNEIENLSHEEGKVFEIEGDKKAIYKDDHGRLHVLDAHCTHLGCIVKFNMLEKSWDCPCHGSRFDIEGKVLNGPATAALDN